MTHQSRERHVGQGEDGTLHAYDHPPCV